MKEFKMLLITLGIVLLMNGKAYSMCSCEPGEWLSFGSSPASIIELYNGCDCKGCGAPCYRAIAKLNMNSGVYETIGMYPFNIGYMVAADLSHNRIFTEEAGNLLTFHAISISDMKVVGTFTLDTSSGTDLDAFQPNLVVSPDGSRIVASWQDGPNYINTIEIFDGKKFKSIVKLDFIMGNISKDGKYLYSQTSPRPNGRILYTVDLNTGRVISQFDLNIIDAYSNLDRKGWGGRPIGNGDFWGLGGISRLDNHMLIDFIYNPVTKGVSPTITSYYSKERVYNSPNVKWWIKDVGHKEIDIYDIWSGNKIGGFSISDSTDNGTIINWPNDHTFIYNTTQQLIYFDINQNKGIKELPIIRPWEQKGWKPEVGK